METKTVSTFVNVTDNQEAFLAFLKQEFHTFHPFDEGLIDFCDSLSKNIFKHGGIKKYPELLTLAFWLRKSHINELAQNFLALQQKGNVFVPRGLAFHIPPSNVDTMFVYSWILSLLTGNTNIVRVPTTQTPSSKQLMAVVQDTLAQTKFHEIAKENLFISYGYDEEVTEKISSQADIRVIWGGDKTVQAIRKIPLKPTGKEIAFPDRFSFSAIHSANYLSSSEKQKKQLSMDFFNDTYWFDQAACSSPRAIFWVGSKKDILEACEDFYATLANTIQQRNFKIPLGGVLEKITFTHSQILNLPVTEIRSFGNELTVAFLKEYDSGIREHCGRGFLYHLELEKLKDLRPLVLKKDQTLSYFGFSYDELTSLASQINGRGVDRYVPIGKALSFEYIWDGYHLLNEFTRLLKIE